LENLSRKNFSEKLSRKNLQDKIQTRKDFVTNFRVKFRRHARVLLFVSNTQTTEMDLSLKTPYSILLSGTSRSGKTYFTMRLLQHAEDMFDHPFEKIVYSYGEFQPLFIEMKNDIGNIC